jgi:hypothetical protein
VTASTYLPGGRVFVNPAVWRRSLAQGNVGTWRLGVTCLRLEVSHPPANHRPGMLIRQAAAFSGGATAQLPGNRAGKRLP